VRQMPDILSTTLFASLWTTEETFAGCLLAGFVFCLLAFPLASRRFHLHGRLLRFLRFHSKLAKAQDRFGAIPGAVPATIAALLVGYGFTGLVLRVLLHINAAASVAGAAVGAVAFAAACIWMLFKLFSGQAKPTQGVTLLGLTCTVTLTIPAKGVGAISYVVEGQRRTMPAKTTCGDTLVSGSRGMIVDFDSGVALIDEM
jgi:hypothetical protein